MGMDNEGTPHTLSLKDRKLLTLTGVSEVVSFDESAVVLETGMGTLLIQGQQLQLKNLTLEGGQVAVEGHIGAMVYQQSRQGGWLRRLMG